MYRCIQRATDRSMCLHSGMWAGTSFLNWAICPNIKIRRVVLKCHLEAHLTETGDILAQLVESQCLRTYCSVREWRSCSHAAVQTHWSISQSSSTPRLETTSWSTLRSLDTSSSAWLQHISCNGTSRAIWRGHDVGATQWPTMMMTYKTNKQENSKEVTTGTRSSSKWLKHGRNFHSTITTAIIQFTGVS